MSYDLMVFEVEKAPKSKEEFMRWYETLTEWGEGHSYDDVSICCPALQSWYREMRTFFPAMNGPDAASEDEIDADEESGEHKISDYSVARDAIYIAFSWSQAENAYQKTRELAEKHGVGFFDVSGADGDIILPNTGLRYSMRTQQHHYRHEELDASVLTRHLDAFSPDHWDFMVLEPSLPIGRSIFLQIGSPSDKTDFQIVVEIGMDNPERIELYQYHTRDKTEVLQMLTDYLERQQLPDYGAWEDISDSMNQR